jgi:hypothetical protein
VICGHHKATGNQEAGNGLYGGGACRNPDLARGALIPDRAANPEKASTESTSASALGNPDRGELEPTSALWRLHNDGSKAFGVAYKEAVGL